MRYRISDRSARLRSPRGVGLLRVSADGHKLVYRAAAPVEAADEAGRSRGEGAPAPSLFLVDADRTPPQAGTGRLNATLRMYLDPKEEFKQIFYEGWRNQRDYLYVPNMHGADWPRMKEIYGQMLPYVMHRADLNYLLDIMGAEIAIGHCFVRGGDMPSVPQLARGGCWAPISRSTTGATGSPKSTTTRAGIRTCMRPWPSRASMFRVGDYILAVNGEELKAPDNIYRLLDGTANLQTVLSVNKARRMEGAHQVTVVPVANEQTLRTRAWVEDNRRLVDKLSDGKLAYVYVPTTGQPGYASFNRYYFAQQDKLGVVVDERYNSGGSAADYIIDVLQRAVRRLL